MRIISKKKNSAALIIAMIIVAVVGIVVVSAGRIVVQSALSATRYPNSIIANSLAWAGVESSLLKFKNGQTYTSSINELSYSNPTFTKSIRDDFLAGNVSTYKVAREKIIQGTGTREIIGDPEITGDPNPNGVNYTRLLTDTDGGYTYSWNMSDSFIDTNISTSDFDSGPSGLPSVNVDSSGNIINKSKYFKVPSSETAPVWRIFDMKNWNNLTDNSVIFKYNSTELSANATATFYIKYINAPHTYTILGAGNLYPAVCTSTATNLIVNEKLCAYGFRPVGCQRSSTNTTEVSVPTGGCYDNTKKYSDGSSISSVNYQGHYAAGNFFINQDETITFGSLAGSITVYIPPSRTSRAQGDIEYMAISFTNITGGNLYFGLQQNAIATTTSYISTGMAHIFSTGIYSGIRKTVEVWAAKNLKLNTTTGNLECKNTTSTNLATCNMTIFRNPN